MSNSTTSLVELRQHYALVIAQFQRRAVQAKAKIADIDALLIAELVRGRALSSAPSAQLQLPTRLESLESRPVSAAVLETTTRPELNGAVRSTIAAPTSQEPAQRQDSLPLQPDYQGLTKLQAIMKALTAEPNLVLHQDSIIERLYGTLSPEQLRLESRRMRASLFQGLKKGLWRRAAEPSSYIAEAQDPSKNPPQREAASESSQAPAKTSATLSRSKLLPKLIKLKPGKPPTTRTRKKASKLTSEQPERKQLEIVALLRKPSFSL